MVRQYQTLDSLVARVKRGVTRGLESSFKCLLISITTRPNFQQILAYLLQFETMICQLFYPKPVQLNE